ncbi:MAG: phosphohydrolase, partial [Defluviitaleaceae bacterium]|nr:phosphohydrolase [Defluviitaleaceae bacterium]
AERKIMENHVEITSRLLSKIQFSKQYSEVPTFAADHHEKLNGKGYPFGKSETELPLGTRILTILDVFEALTAKDRPYKKPMPLEKVFAILDDMTQKGEVDPTLTAWLKKWKM